MNYCVQKDTISRTWAAESLLRVLKEYEPGLIGQMQNFDAAQSQDLLRSLTSGLGVALLTTMVGLVGNILLGLQLTRLDRYADVLVADAQRIGRTIGAAHGPASSKGD